MYITLLLEIISLLILLPQSCSGYSHHLLDFNISRLIVLIEYRTNLSEDLDLCLKTSIFAVCSSRSNCSVVQKTHKFGVFTVQTASFFRFRPSFYDSQISLVWIVKRRSRMIASMFVRESMHAKFAFKTWENKRC